MSIEVMRLVFLAEGLEPRHKLVLLALADHATDEGTSIFPSADLVGRKTGLSERTVRKVLGELRSDDLHLLKVAREATQHRPTEYALDLPAMQVWIPSGVQSSHPSDNPGVLDMHPSDSPGVQITSSGVQKMSSRGANLAPESSVNHQEPSPLSETSVSDEPDPLTLSISPAGVLLSSELETYYGQLGRRAPQKYKSVLQRDAYEAAITTLGGQAIDLIRKGLARERVSLSSLLGWLEACAKNRKADAPIKVTNWPGPARKAESAGPWRAPGGPNGMPR